MVAAAWVLGLAAACGEEESGESGGESGEDFLASVSSLCIESSETVRDANLELGYSQDPKDQTKLANLVTEKRAAITDEIAALEAPEENADAFADYVEVRKEYVTADQARAKAVKSGDPAKIEKANEVFSKTDKAEDKAAEDLGAEGCDGVLPQDEAQAAEDALREFSTTADPATSCDFKEGLVSEPYLKEGFGGVEACEAEQKRLRADPSLLPKDIDVEDVTGVEGVAATIDYADVKGEYADEPSTAILYNVDGGWKLFSIGPQG